VRSSDVVAPPGSGDRPAPAVRGRVSPARCGRPPLADRRRRAGEGAGTYPGGDRNAAADRVAARARRADFERDLAELGPARTLGPGPGARWAGRAGER